MDYNMEMNRMQWCHIEDFRDASTEVVTLEVDSQSQLSQNPSYPNDELHL